MAESKNHITKFEHPRVILSALPFPKIGLISATMETERELALPYYYSKHSVVLLSIFIVCRNRILHKIN